MRGDRSGAGRVAAHSSDPSGIAAPGPSGAVCCWSCGHVDPQHLTAEVWREGIEAGDLLTVQIIPAEGRRWCQAAAEVERENPAHEPEVNRIGTAARCGDGCGGTALSSLPESLPTPLHGARVVEAESVYLPLPNMLRRYGVLVIPYDETSLAALCLCGLLADPTCR